MFPAICMPMQKTALWLSTSCACLLLSACFQDEPPTPPAAEPATAPAAVAPVAAPAAAPSVMAELFSHDVLGMNLAYVEKLAGPAIRSQMHYHHFKVEGCEFVLKTDDKDKAVVDMEIEITPTCNLPLEPLLGSFADDTPRLHDLNFTNLQETLGGAFYADCLTMCGNAYDPSVYMHAEGPRALNFVEFQLRVKLVDDAAIEASNLWEEAMKAGESEDYVIDTRFNCEPYKYREVAAKAFAKVKPHSLRFGSGLAADSYETDCKAS